VNRVPLVLAAVIPALAIAGLLLGVVAWRTHAQTAEQRERTEQERRSFDEMRRLGEQLRASRADTQKWHDQWAADTKRLATQLEDANAALATSVRQREQAKAEMDALAKQIAELGDQIKALKSPTPPAPETK
jgi:hypothetical protein